MSKKEEETKNNMILAISPWLSMSHINYISLIDNLAPKMYTKGKIVYLQSENSDYVYLIKKGRVALSNISTEGNSRIIFIADEEFIFGKLSFFDLLPNTCCSIVISDTAEIFEIPKSRFQTKLDNDNKFCQQMLQTMSKTIRSLIIQIQMITFHSAQTRVCYALIHLLSKYSEKIGDEYKITMTFTHQEIADVTGLSRVSVSETLSFMVKQNIIQKKEGHYIIKNPVQLYNLLLKESKEEKNPSFL